jgi:hypothetical protein
MGDFNSQRLQRYSFKKANYFRSQGVYMTQIFVDHNTLINIAADIAPDLNESEDYQEFLDQVRQQVYSLNSNHRTVAVKYYFENLEIEQIAAETGLNEQDIRKLLRESLLILKSALTEIVRRRWPDRFLQLKTCPICDHPAKIEIERIISMKKPEESWGTINQRMKRMIGCSFNPPILMINHLKYHNKR